MFGGNSFWSDNWKKIAGGILAAVLIASGIVLPNYFQSDRIDANELGVADNATAIGDNLEVIGVNRANIDTLELWQDGFYGEDGEWWVFIDYVNTNFQGISDSLTAHNARIADLEEWLEAFWNEEVASLGEWQLFLEDWEAFQSTYQAAWAAQAAAWSSWYSDIASRLADLEE